MELRALTWTMQTCGAGLMCSAMQLCNIQGWPAEPESGARAQQVPSHPAGGLERAALAQETSLHKGLSDPQTVLCLEGEREGDGVHPRGVLFLICIETPCQLAEP